MFLFPSDFYLSPNLSIYERGIVVFLFHSPECPYSLKWMSLFQSLQSCIAGILFGSVNVSKYPEIVSIASGSTHPISYVPLLVIFNEGCIDRIYHGTADLEEMKHFVLATSHF